MRKVDFNTFANSQENILNYMSLKKGNGLIYEAKITVHKNKKIVYNDTLEVCPKIETNKSIVEIFGDKMFDKFYYTGYNNEYQRFTLKKNTLIVECKDKLGNPIEIHIT